MVTGCDKGVGWFSKCGVWGNSTWVRWFKWNDAGNVVMQSMLFLANPWWNGKGGLAKESVYSNKVLALEFLTHSTVISYSYNHKNTLCCCLAADFSRCRLLNGNIILYFIYRINILNNGIKDYPQVFVCGEALCYPVHNDGQTKVCVCVCVSVSLWWLKYGVCEGGRYKWVNCSVCFHGILW